MSVSLQEGKQLFFKIAFSMIVSTLFTMVLLLLLSLIVLKCNPSDFFVKTGMIGIKMIACFVGGLFCAKKSKKRKFLWGLLIGGIYVFLLMLIRQCMGNHGPILVWTNLFTALACLGCGMLGGMISR